MMNQTRRKEILTAYAGHVRRFDEIASRPHSSTGYFPGGAAAAFAPSEPRPVVPSDTDCLSNREREVLSLVAQGLSNREIGSQLHVSEETVKSHVRHTLLRLGVRNRAHAVSVGHLRGILI
jgi:DNA-binding NarL/FixJ family response regulator